MIASTVPNEKKTIVKKIITPETTQINPNVVLSRLVNFDPHSSHNSFINAYLPNHYHKVSQWMDQKDFERYFLDHYLTDSKHFRCLNQPQLLRQPFA